MEAKRSIRSDYRLSAHRPIFDSLWAASLDMQLVYWLSALVCCSTYTARKFWQVVAVRKRTGDFKSIRLIVKSSEVKALFCVEQNCSEV